MLTQKDLNPLLNKKIKDEYYANKSFKEISKICNCSERAVAFSLKKQKINTRLKNRYLVNSNYFNEINSEYKKYLIGLINADGCLGKNNYFALQLIDKDLIEEIAKEFNIKKNIRIINNKSGYKNAKLAYRINFSDKNFYESLIQHNAKDLSWNNINLSEDGIYNWSFILGVFDGDGCIYLNKNRSGGLVNIIAEHSVCNKIKKFTGMGQIKQHDEKMSYWRIYSKNDFIKFYQNCYKEDFGLKRKKIKLEKLIGSYEDYKKRKA